MTPRLLLETNVHPYQLHENLSTPKDLKTVTVSTLVGLKTGTMSKAKRITKSDKKTAIQTRLRETKQKIASGRSLKDPRAHSEGNKCEQTVTVSLLSPCYCYFNPLFKSKVNSRPRSTLSFN